MSGAEFDFSYVEECKNCHGRGELFFSGYKADEVHLFCTLNDFSESLKRPKYLECNVCHGVGKIPLEEIELDKTKR